MLSLGFRNIVCALYVFDKMLKLHFLVVLDSDECQILRITIIIHVHYVLIIGCVFYTLFPMITCSCIGHASHMHIRCTFDTHTLTLDMFCIHSCQLSLFRPFSIYNMFLMSISCLGLYLVPSFLACHVYFMLCNILFLRCFIFCLSFIFSFILHPSCIITLVHIFFSFPPSS